MHRSEWTWVEWLSVQIWKYTSGCACTEWLIVLLIRGEMTLGRHINNKIVYCTLCSTNIHSNTLHKHKHMVIGMRYDNDTIEFRYAVDVYMYLLYDYIMFYQTNTIQHKSQTPSLCININIILIIVLDTEKKNKNTCCYFIFSFYS